MKKIISIFLASILFLTLALPSKTSANTKLFTDVPSTNASYTDVMYLLDNGVIEPAAKFGLNDIITREELVVMIAKALGLSGTPRKTKFNDVPKSNVNSGYIQSAVDAGIAKGITNTKFDPKAKLTRGQIAAFIARAFELPKGKTTFKDVPSNHYAYEYMQQLVAAKIAAGYPDGTFKPNLNLTRAHSAAFLARAMRYAGNKETVTVASLAETWANALKTRDGKPRYEMMSDAAKEKFKKQQMVISGNNWNYIIGNSSPWVVNYEIKIEGMKATITYLTQTSKPEYYNTQETVTFATDKNGKLYVKDYETVFENKLVETKKDTVASLAETWANALKTRDGKPRYDMMSDAAKEKFKKQQIKIGGNNWNYIIGNSSPWVVSYEIKVDGMKATITYLTQTSKPEYYNTQETVTFATDKNGKLYVKDYETVFENKLVETQKETIAKLADTWANALKTRDGKPRYDMMSDAAKEKFKNQQIKTGGKNWNYIIGNSSPWVVSYEIKVDGMKATITYLTQTSKPEYYNTQETVTFATDKNGKLYVKDYETVFENKLVESQKEAITKLADTWANALKTRDGKPRYEMMSNEAKEKFKKQQIRLYGDGKNWNYTIGASSPWVVDYEIKIEGLTATITYLTQTSDATFYNTKEVVTFAVDKNGKHFVKDYETVFENRIIDSGKVKTVANLAEVWANALKTRDGKPRYEMMSNEAKEKFKKQQILLYGDGKNWNYTIGASSPWVVDYEIKIEGMTATITYLTQTSAPAYFNTKEAVTFVMENGKFIVKDYETVFENRSVDSSKVKTVANLAEVWANALKTRNGKPRYEMMSNEAKEKFKKQQILLYGDGKNWNYTIGASSPWVVDYEIEIEGMTATITYLTQTSDATFYNTKEVVTFTMANGNLIVKDYDTIFENRLVENKSKTIANLAETWANALKTRDGKPRYDMMTNQAKEKFKKQQIIRFGDGKNWNYNIGVSSPWVVDYEIKIDGMIATITYLAQTSDPTYFQTKEVVTFTLDNGKILVKDYETIQDYELIEKK